MDRIRKGDRVDFGAYGLFYVACVGNGRSLWVTKKKWYRRDAKAPGQYIEARCAKQIIERYKGAK